MKKMIQAAALVLVMGSAGVPMAAEEVAAVATAQVASAGSCMGVQTEVPAEMTAANRSEPTLPGGEPGDQPTGTWPDCPPEFTCQGDCHRDPFSCTEHPWSGGDGVCGWDGTINPPEFLCPKNQTIWIQNCDCVVDYPGAFCSSGGTQTMFCN